MTTTDASTHLYVLLDRSGSMESMREEVVAGLNTFIADQQAEEPDAKLTLVQFDGDDPHDVMAEGIPLVEAMPLTHADFQPRGNTPLLDATVRIIGQASTRESLRAVADLPAEEIIVLTITDGLENASHEFHLAAVRKLIEAKQAAGWTFTFLSAAVDAYGDALSMGYDDRSVQAFAADGEGATAMFLNVSQATNAHREDRRTGKVDKRDFFKGEKPAEEDRTRRKSS